MENSANIKQGSLEKDITTNGYRIEIVNIELSDIKNENECNDIERIIWEKTSGIISAKTKKHASQSFELVLRCAFNVKCSKLNSPTSECKYWQIHLPIHSNCSSTSPGVTVSFEIKNIDTL